MAKKTVVFNHGKYKEIFPPPLVEGITPKMALSELINEMKSRGLPVDELQKNPKYASNLAMAYHHQMRMREVMAGGTDLTETEKQLHEAIMAGEPMSLRIVGLENEPDRGEIVPILRRVGDKRYQLGIMGVGSVYYIEGEGEEVMIQAQKLTGQLAK